MKNVDFAHLFVPGGVARLACIHRIQALRKGSLPRPKICCKLSILDYFNRLFVVNGIGNTRYLMKPQAILLAALGYAVFICAASASPRNSAHYSIDMDSIDQGGGMLVSADYSINASINDSGATASESASGYVVKGGYIGQLFDVVGVIPTASASNIGEGLTLQLGAAQVLDDATLLPFSPSLAAWSVVSGPISGIGANGLASAAIVYQDTQAAVRASYQGFTGTLSLTVLNVNTDDYGSYAGDGIPDDWQVRNFGLNNPNAAPNKDTTGTGQTNLFKYVAGLDPTDPTSVFRVSVKPVLGQPNQKQIVFSPVLPGRTYTVYYSTDMASWNALTGASQSDSDSERTLTDTGVAVKAKFYKVKISNP